MVAVNATFEPTAKPSAVNSRRFSNCPLAASRVRRRSRARGGARSPYIFDRRLRLFSERWFRRIIG
jgi:hypothetical protein